MHKIFANTLFIGKKVIYLPTCHSTNDIASDYIAKSDISEGTIITTSHQTAGRGQRGNTWESEPEQNLTFSLILKPKFLMPYEQFWLNIAVSVAIIDFLKQFNMAQLKVKWPNDIYCHNKKMGGILIENFIKSSCIEHAIIGIGLNVNQRSFGYTTATSLFKETKKNYQLDSLIEDLLIHLERRYLELRNNSKDRLKILYLDQLFRFQERHEFEDLRTSPPTRFYGQIIGINSHGMLAVEINRQVNYFGFKEIKFVL